MEIVFDIEQLTIGDVEDVEEYMKAGIESLDWSKPSAKLITAMVWINERRKNPAYTIEDARKVRFGDLKRAEANPTSGGDAS